LPGTEFVPKAPDAVLKLADVGQRLGQKRCRLLERNLEELHDVRVQPVHGQRLPRED
jgi:hypothetical protein